MAIVTETVIDLHDLRGEVEYPFVNRSTAKPEDVAYVLAADPNEEDGYTRSQWQWFRLPNGDLILGVFPQDTTYFDVVDRTGV